MDIITKLTAFATKLEDKGLMSLASDVDGATATFVKVAKELGGQGYWVQNGRCWAGCYRSKRASRPKTSAQDIWFECQEEYEKAISGNSDDWNKYASQTNGTTKTAEAQKFASTVQSLVASGDDIGTAVFSTISKNVANIRIAAIDAAESMIAVSDRLSESDIILSTEAAELSAAMVKEAWGLGGLSNVVAPAVNKMKGLGPNSKGVNLSNLSTLLNQLNQTLQGFIKQKQAFESAVKNSPGVPPALQQQLFKGMRPLSQQSMQQMQQSLQQYQSMGQKKDFTDGLPKMTPEDQAQKSPVVTSPQGLGATPGNPAGLNLPRAKNQNAALDHSKAEPTDPGAVGSNVDNNKNGVPDSEEGIIPLKPEEPMEETHDEKQFANDLSGIPDNNWSSLMQQAAQLMGQAEAMSSTRSAMRKLYSLMKTANPGVFTPQRRRVVSPPATTAPTNTTAPSSAIPSPTPAPAPQATVNPAVSQVPAAPAAQQVVPPISPEQAKEKGIPVEQKKRTPKVKTPDATTAPVTTAPSATEDAANSLTSPVNITKQDFTSRFNALTPDAKQYIMKSLAPKIKEIKDQVAQNTQQSFMGDTMASSKKRMFKLA